MSEYNLVTRLWNELKCLVGRHDWQYVEDIYPLVRYCERCRRTETEDSVLGWMVYKKEAWR